MCRHCRHPDLRVVREEIRASYDPIAVFGGDRKKALKVISARLREAKNDCKQARRHELPLTYRVDYIRRLLTFAAWVLNYEQSSESKWNNGGNYFVG